MSFMRPVGLFFSYFVLSMLLVHVFYFNCFAWSITRIGGVCLVICVCEVVVKLLECFVP